MDDTELTKEELMLRMAQLENLCDSHGRQDLFDVVAWMRDMLVESTERAVELGMRLEQANATLEHMGQQPV